MGWVGKQIWEKFPQNVFFWGGGGGSPYIPDIISSVMSAKHKLPCWQPEIYLISLYPQHLENIADNVYIFIMGLTKIL